jgi:hypothetical protein
MLNSDELLVKRTHSKQECVQIQSEFKRKVSKKLKQIESISCEQGELMESYDAGGKKEDEVL